MAPTTKKKKLISCLLAGGEPSSCRNLELKKKNLNVSAGRVFYERASSRRERHRAALQAADLDTVALGRHSCKRGSSTPAVLSKNEHDGSKLSKMRTAVAIAKQRALKMSPSGAATDKTSIVAKRRKTVCSANHDFKQNSNQVMNAAPTTRLPVVVPQRKNASGSSRSMLGKAVKTGTSRSTASRSSSCQPQHPSSSSCTSHQNKKRSLDNLDSRSTTTARSRHSSNTAAAFDRQKKKVQKGIMPPSPQHVAAAGK